MISLFLNDIANFRANIAPEYEIILGYADNRSSAYYKKRDKISAIVAVVACSHVLG